ncbi:MarR family winged helix-turn-helix transcriptional regulator [Streptomyces sp. NPDC091272]|uniref:MarR family winged helix-turn-helix transcriptional regulator n=1 Tax=Streptomyces sp. NPDC091272 TaxID=3365981 RepID=UPI0038091811
MSTPKNAARNDATPATGGPRWLSDEEQRVWRAYIHATTLLDDTLDRQLQRDAGMPHMYYGLLVQLAQAPGHRMRMTELARNAKITRSRLSHAVSRLEKNGWVRRQDCTSDKRGQNAILTEEGYGVLRDAAPQHVSLVRKAIFDRLSEEQVRQLGEIMCVIADGLEPTGTGADLPWLR